MKELRFKNALFGSIVVTVYLLFLDVGFYLGFPINF